MLLLASVALAFDVSSPACVGTRTLFTATEPAATAWAWNVGGVSASKEASFEWIFSAPGTSTVQLTMETAADDIVESQEVTVSETPTVTLGGPIFVKAHEQDDYLATGPDGATFSWVVEGGTLLGDTSGDAVVVEWGEVEAGRIEVTGLGSGPCPGVEHLDVEITLPGETPGGTDTGTVDEGCGCAHGTSALSATFLLLPLLSRRRVRRG